MSKISALIFSINEYELIKPKIKLLYPYVDEIVIIDSSTNKNQKRLMKNLEKKYKKVRIIWLPPIGIADFYYKIGINECKYEWIFQLDADDTPNKKLLKDLRKLVNDKYDAYEIYRPYEGYHIFRLYRSSVASPFCLIHHLMSIKGKNYKELERSVYFIFSPFTFKGYKKKEIKYSKTDSYQQLFKIYVAKFFAKYNKNGYSFPREFFITHFISKIFHKIYKSYLLAILVFLKYSLLNIFYSIFRAFLNFYKTGSVYGIRYPLLIHYSFYFLC